MTYKHPRLARNTAPLPVVESPLDAFKLGADVRGMQRDVEQRNAKFRKTNEHIIAGVAAWSAYRKFRSR
jgi:hypothetical protein